MRPEREGDFAMFTHRSSSYDNRPLLEWEEGWEKGRPVRSVPGTGLGLSLLVMKARGEKSRGSWETVFSFLMGASLTSRAIRHSMNQKHCLFEDSKEIPHPGCLETQTRTRRLGAVRVR